MSSATCGVSTTSIFGGLCSGNSRRPSMFTAKYRLREERKKVLKMSMAKVKRIEDPESFLRRSVLINNTIKRLQREVREEKMMRHGGYTSKLSCTSFRKSFACSRLSDMHLPDDEPRSPRHPHNNHHHPQQSHHNNNNNNNSRKRRLSDDSEDDCDVQAVLSQIYVPPTPCIISSLDDADLCDSPSDSLDGPTSASSKRAKLSLSAQLVTDDDDCSLDVDVDGDVDVVGDSETSDWPTPPEPILLEQVSSSCSPGVEVEVDVDVDVDVLSCSTSVVESSVADCEFSLDLHPPLGEVKSLASLTSSVEIDPMSSVVTTCVSPVTTSTTKVPLSPYDDCDMTSESDTKENTCVSSSNNTNNPLIIPSTDHRKCNSGSNSSSHHSNHHNHHHNHHHSHSHGGPGGLGGPGSMSPPSPADSSNSSSSSSLSSASSTASSNSTADKQYSSCGHSSIFGELQSVVFHSLIASLET